MNKTKYIIGIAAMGVLLFSVFMNPVISANEIIPEDEGMEIDFFPEGDFDISLNVELKHNPITGPTFSAPTGMINRNFYYVITDFETPVDQYIGVPIEIPDGPTIEVDATLVGSELMAKVINDQDDILDWSGAFTLGENITFDFTFPNWADLWPEMGVPAEIPMFPFEIIPSEFVIPEGSSTGPIPYTVRTTDTWESFVDYLESQKQRGFEGPTVFPSIFYQAPGEFINEGSWWNGTEGAWKFFNDTMYDDDDSDDVTFETYGYSDGSELTTTFYMNRDNETGYQIVNLSTSAHYNTLGYLDFVEVEAMGDMDGNSIVEADERIYVAMELDHTTQENIPLSVGDKGEYLLDMNLEYDIDFADVEVGDSGMTLDELADMIIYPIIDNITAELTNLKFFNYSVSAVDGLYYTIDGYMLDVGAYSTDMLNYASGGIFAGEEPIIEVKPDVEDYYMPSSESDQDIIISMFDGMLYGNTTKFFEFRDSMHYDDFGEYSISPFNNSHVRLENMPGIEYAYVYNETDFRDAKEALENDFNDFSAKELLANLTGKEVYMGTVEYKQFEPHEDHTEYNGDMGIVPWINAPEGTFDDYYNTTYDIMKIWPETSKSLAVIVEIQELPGYRTYSSIFNFISNMDGLDPGLIVGMIIPKPVKTTDWELTEGPILFADAFVNVLNDFFGDSTLHNWLEVVFSAATNEGGETIDISMLDFGIDYEENTTNVSTKSWFDLAATVTGYDNESNSDITIAGEVSTGAKNMWDKNGVWLSTGFYLDLQVSIGVVELPDPTTTPDDNSTDVTTTTTQDDNVSSSDDTTTPGEENTTDPGEETTPDVSDLVSPGFGALVGVISLVALPLIFKRRK